MRTFALLTAILLVALQAKAEPVPPAADEALGQERSEEGSQPVAVSVPTDEESALQDPGAHNHGKTCTCKQSACIHQLNGFCIIHGVRFNMCCPH